MADALANPRLSILRGAELVAQNDDWSAGPEAAALAAAFGRLGAFPLTTGSAATAFQVTCRARQLHDPNLRPARGGHRARGNLR